MCPDDWDTIESAEECEAAALALGGSYKGEGNWPIPYGCVGDIVDGGSVYFNTNEDGPARIHRRTICMQQRNTEMNILSGISIERRPPSTQNKKALGLQNTFLKIFEIFERGLDRIFPRENLFSNLQTIHATFGILRIRFGKLSNHSDQTIKNIYNSLHNIQGFQMRVLFLLECQENGRPFALFKIPSHL